MYKLVKNSITGEIKMVSKIVDNGVAYIPFSEDNTDYQAYLKWLEESPDNKPLPADEQ